MIYSRKYGRTFRNRSELMRYEWRDRQTKPILPWFGLRDAPYSGEYRKEHGLKPQKNWVLWWLLVLIVGIAFLVLFVAGR